LILQQNKIGAKKNVKKKFNLRRCRVSRETTKTLKAFATADIKIQKVEEKNK